MRTTAGTVRGSHRTDGSGSLPWTWLPWATTALAAAGVAIASYLTVAHYTSPHVLACPDTGLINCLKVTTSPESSILGVPVAVIGLCYFGALLYLCLPATWSKAGRAVVFGRQLLVSAGMLFVLYLVGTELIVLKAICAWCTAVHVVEFLLFVLVTSATSAMTGSRADT